MTSPKQTDPYDRMFNHRDFVRTLSYREFLTCFSVSLMCLATQAVLDFYSSEPWAIEYRSMVLYTIVTILFLLTHVFYKLEHKRPNTFIGRNFHDYILIFMYIILYVGNQFATGSGYSVRIRVGSIFAFIFVMIVAVMFLETAVAIVKRLLKLLGWQIL